MNEGQNGKWEINWSHKNFGVYGRLVKSNHFQQLKHTNFFILNNIYLSSLPHYYYTCPRTIINLMVIVPYDHLWGLRAMWALSMGCTFVHAPTTKGTHHPWMNIVSIPTTHVYRSLPHVCFSLYNYTLPWTKPLSILWVLFRSINNSREFLVH